VPILLPPVPSLSVDAGDAQPATNTNTNNGNQEAAIVFMGGTVSTMDVHYNRLICGHLPNGASRER
jgi:hypothetical protein